MREQELMNEFVSASMLPVCRIDISDNDVAGAVERIADWMEATGGLTME